MNMFPRISLRLLPHYIVKSKCRRDLRARITDTACPVFSIDRRLSTSSVYRLQEETTRCECKSNEFESTEFNYNDDRFSAVCEEPDEFEEEHNYEDIDFEAITNNEPKKVEALRTILQEIHALREKGSPFVPNNVPLHRWQMLLECETPHDRRSLLKHIFLMERREENEKKIKAAKRLKYEKTPKPSLPPPSTSTFLPYKLSCNSLLYRQRGPIMSMCLNYRLAKAEWFGSSLIIDCGYESYMNSRELHHCCTQLTLSWVNNRMNRDPFNIIFCNINENSAVHKYFARIMPTVSKAESPVNFTKKHYLDLFPAEKLIYLSPHSEYEMEEYEPDCAYIIGAFVDEAVHDPVSMQRAKRDGIRTARFPLDKYLNWCQGSQLLPMNQCVAIMNHLRNGVPWEEALRCVARRKLNYVGLNFKKDPKLHWKSARHMWGIYSYEMGKEPIRKAPCEI